MSALRFVETKFNINNQIQNKDMPNYNNAAQMGKELFFKYITERRKELGISQLKLSQLIEMDESTLIRNLKSETEMTLLTFIKICGALEIRPYLIPKESDDTEINNRIDFN